MPTLTQRRRAHPSLTAEAVTVCRAGEQRRTAATRIVDDPYARRFLTPGGRAALAAWKAAGPAAAAFERIGPGLATFVVCRHRYIDEALTDALDGGAGQVVILGAGYDTRAYRFADRLAGRTVFEVDLAAISRRKAEIIAKARGAFPSVDVRRVEIDFEQQTLGDALPAAGFEPGAGTFVAWEGVSMYLTRAAVKATVASLYELTGPGSTLAMDCWYYSDEAGAMGAARRAAPGGIALVGEPVRFGIHPEDVPGFLEPLGFDVTDVAGSQELGERFVADGRAVEPSIYVLTARRRPGPHRDD
jgi:methyltransferase (TIGR00027 family)